MPQGTSLVTSTHSTHISGNLWSDRKMFSFHPDIRGYHQARKIEITLWGHIQVHINSAMVFSAFNYKTICILILFDSYTGKPPLDITTANKQKPKNQQDEPCQFCSSNWTSLRKHGPPYPPLLKWAHYAAPPARALHSSLYRLPQDNNKVLEFSSVMELGWSSDYKTSD